DDVLQLLVALEDALDLPGHRVVLGANDVGIEDAAGGVQRVDGRVNAQLGDGTAEHRGGVEVGKGRGRGRVGQVVGRDVDGLHRGDRALGGGGDAFLKCAHL